MLSEAHFHTNKLGVSGLLEGELSPDMFMRAMLGYWYERPWKSARGVGLRNVTSRDRLETIVREFSKSYPTDPDRAAATLVEATMCEGLIDPSKPCWVDHTPRNVLGAGALFRVMPSLRLVNVTRSGLDMAASADAQWWTNDHVLDRLRAWAFGYERADIAVRDLPDHMTITLPLEDLVELDRTKALARLAALVGFEDDARGYAEVRRYVENEVTAERAHIGRWKDELSGWRADRFLRLYRDLLLAMRRSGVATLPYDGDDVLRAPRPRRRLRAGPGLLASSLRYRARARRWQTTDLPLRAAITFRGGARFADLPPGIRTLGDG